MQSFMWVVGGILTLAGVIGGVMLLMEAFRSSNRQGWLCLTVPFYKLYYGFVRLDSPRRGWIIGLWIGCGVPGSLMLLVAALGFKN